MIFISTNVQDLHTSTPLQFQKFRRISFNMLVLFLKRFAVCDCLFKTTDFRIEFNENLSEFHKILRVTGNVSKAIFVTMLCYLSVILKVIIRFSKFC